MTTPDVTAILVAWNSGTTLAACAESLRASAEAAGLSLEIVVVDNGSTDGAVDALAAPSVVIRNPINAGYGVAAAQGLERASAAWALLVNPDVVVAAEFFGALGRAMRDAENDVATLVPELRFASDRDTVSARGIAVDEIGVPLELDVGAPVTNDLLEHDVLGGSSGCSLFRMDVLRLIGGPEPIFFAYLEDVDVALRLQRAGYRARFVPTAVAWHLGSASTGQGSSIKTYLVARNRRILFRLHGPQTLRAMLWRGVVDVGHGLFSSSTGRPLAPWLGRLDSLRLRRYADFLRCARRDQEPHISKPPRIERIGLSETLRRKRAATRRFHG